MKPSGFPIGYNILPAKSKIRRIRPNYLHKTAVERPQTLSKLYFFIRDTLRPALIPKNQNSKLYHIAVFFLSFFCLSFS